MKIPTGGTGAKIGIVGFGVVGRAIARGFKRLGFEVVINDLCKDKLQDENFKFLSKRDLMNYCDFVFLCIDTPLDKENKKSDLSSINRAIDELSKCPLDRKIIIIKSTIPPGTTKRYMLKYPKMAIVYSPEFLRERSAEQDFLRPDRIVLAGKHEHVTRVKELFNGFSTNFVLLEDPTIAEMIKYASNCLLATKVSYANQIRLLCDRLGIDAKVVMDAVMLDHRFGKSHLDPMKGAFKGRCLPKDLQTLITVGQELGVDVSLLEAVWALNEKIKRVECG
jgi:UDPglucose 6-dehydrogenase